MLNRIFRKDAAAPASAHTPTIAPAASAAPPAIDWTARLAAAQGDPQALLALARAGAPLAVQQAAIDAVTDEAALKQAERDWRGHDRRLHRLVKQRYLAQLAQREARDKAARLIATAEALRLESPIPTNRLVEVAREWNLLEPGLLSAAQREAYAELHAQLTALTHERGDQAMARERWVSEAQAALARLQQALAEVAGGTLPREAWAAADAAARAVAEAAPAGDSRPSAQTALLNAIRTGEQLAPQLDLLDALLNAAPAAFAELLARWEVRTPLAETQLDTLLNQRVVSWQAERDAEQHTRRTVQRAEARERKREAGIELTDALTRALDQGDAALAEGHLADTHRQLVAIDELLHGHAAPAAALGARIDRLQAAYAQLKGWQHWGGGRARDELVLQAEALVAVAQHEPAARGLKVTLKQQAELIDEMRARWKELDRLGGATSRALWKRFDTALKAAYQPVADNQAQQREARTLNLKARQALIEALNHVEGADAAAVSPDWRALAGALEHFRTEWRKLGPVEHTVPRPAQAELAQQMAAAVARLETPLVEVRRLAQLTRERLIERASTLADAARNGSAGRDSIDQVRALQAEWQHEARALPLARGVETALWASFKAAVDAVFAAREAAFSARDAQFQAGSAERSALLNKLDAVPADAAPADIKRVLADVDAAWRRAAPPLRQDAARLDASYRRAYDTLRAQIDGHARRQWGAVCDALAARLALCVELEAQAVPADARDGWMQRWSAHAAPLPKAWEAALARRAGLAADAARGSEPGAGLATDALLLQLELALDLATPAAHQAERHQQKLLAMKAALEGRTPARAAPPLAPGQALTALLGRAGLNVTQSERLSAVLVAIRNGAPIDPG